MFPLVQAKRLPAKELLLPKAEPCTVVILGASGDLTKRKLVPALFRLACAGCMSRHFSVLGIGRSQMTDPVAGAASGSTERERKNLYT